jgi:hypothetical protein
MGKRGMGAEPNQESKSGERMKDEGEAGDGDRNPNHDHNPDPDRAVAG